MYQLNAITMRKTNVELETDTLIKRGFKKYIGKDGEPAIHLINECPK